MVPVLLTAAAVHHHNKGYDTLQRNHGSFSV